MQVLGGAQKTCRVLLPPWCCRLPCLATLMQAAAPSRLPLPCPPYLMEPLSSLICSRSCCASSCRAARSCCSLQMYSAVFCKVVALLTCEVTGCEGAPQARQGMGHPALCTAAGSARCHEPHC